MQSDIGSRNLIKIKRSIFKHDILIYKIEIYVGASDQDHHTPTNITNA